MKLLYLPDELLSTIILEAMWATTTKPSKRPDLLMYERRLTNHPSIQREKVAFVGQICGRLRRITQPLLDPAQLWHDPGARVEINQGHPDVSDAPISLSDPAIRAISFSWGQAVFLPQLPSATLEQLSDLSISRGNGGLGNPSDEVLRSIGSCMRLQNLSIKGIKGSASGTARLFADMAALPTLQSLAIEEVYNEPLSAQPLSLALAQTWSAPLVRLELIWCQNVTFVHFLKLMGKVAATLQVAIFCHDGTQTRLTSESATTVVGSFPHLWRLDIGFGLGPHPYYRGRVVVTYSTTAGGHHQLAQCSPIDIWKAAPRLEYFECTEEIVVKTQKELDEISELRKRDETKRLRIKLETWKGDKGAGWSTDKIQELFVG